MKNYQEINVDEVMERIREEVKINSNATSQKILEIRPEEQPQITLLENRVSHRPLDRFLWNYGIKYRKIINKIPILKIIAEYQYRRLVYQKGINKASEGYKPPEHLGMDFLARNWYYGDFIGQTRAEGLKGKFKLFILKTFGFFSWWQAQINSGIYQELLHLKQINEEKEELFQEMLDQRIHTLYEEFQDLLQSKADQQSLQTIISKINELTKRIREQKLLKFCTF